VLSTEAPTDTVFGVQHDLRDGFVRLLVRGELDLSTVPLLEDVLTSVESWSDPLVIDLSDLSFMDCSGLCAFACAARRASEKGRWFAITGCRPLVSRIFELTGMAGMLDGAVPELVEAHAGG
jgi:anti-anti-sigma factor